MESLRCAILAVSPSRMKQSELGKRARGFFMGTLYPVVVAVSVVFGHVFSVEFYTNILNFLLISLALLLCDTLRPVVMFATTFAYQMSVKNALGHPSYSDYYISGWRLPAFLVLVGIFAVCLFYFFIANGCYKDLGFKKTPLLLPLCVMFFALLLGGAFSEEWSILNFLYGFGQAALLCLLFPAFYIGLRREKGEELISYFVYASMLTALVLIAEVINVYITGGVISGGSAVKEQIIFGWGIWNSAGASLAVLIPVCFIGVLRSKYSALCFAVATLTWLASVFTLSRNAALFGTLAFCASAIIACFVGRYKRIYRWIVAFGALLVLLGIAVMWEKIALILSDYLERGFSDNGRLALWREGIESFLKAPIFGTGYYVEGSGTVVDGSFNIVTPEFFPKRIHQTLIHFLSCTGILGLISYLYYRGSTAIALVRRPTAEKTLLFMSVGVLLAMSFFDEFLFHFIHGMYYNATLAVAFIIYEQDLGRGDALTRK